MKGEYEDWRREEFRDEETVLQARSGWDSERADLRIGTSGWSYKDWEGAFYPRGIKATEMLGHYGRVFRTVEVDSTFYAMPRESVVRNWAARSPEGFLFAAKFPRDITHEHDGLERHDLARAFVERMGLLGEKRGPLLLQFPPGFRVQRLPELARLLEALPSKASYAVEFRHEDWYCEALLCLLREHGVAWVAGVGPDNPPRRPVTADFAYLRWIGDREIETFDRVRVERRAELDRWAGWIEKQRLALREIYGYFNNHYAGHGPASARALLSALGEPAPRLPAPPPDPGSNQGELFD